MRIGIDVCCWSNRRGFGRYTRELVSALVRHHPEHEFVLVADSQTVASSEFPREATVISVATDRQATVAASADGARSLFDLWRISRAATRCRTDVFFYPAVYSYFPLMRRIPIAVVFHDAIAEALPSLIFPGWRSRLFWQAKIWLALRQAHRIATVSESARSQVANAFRYPPNKIHLITEGAGVEFEPDDNPERKRGVRERYGLPPETPLVLYVGGFSPHKNLQGLLRALASLAPVVGPWHLALVGDCKSDSFHSCYQELTELCRQLNLTDRATFTGYVPNDDLVTLYSASSLLVLPSFSEGFGLPVLEAMACGVPVAASNVGSLPEVLGGAGLLFNPHDSADIAATIARLLSAADLRDELRRRGFERAASYSWQTAARQTINLLESMVILDRSTP